MFKGLGTRPIVVQRQCMQLHAQLRCNGFEAGIGERLHADQLAGPGQQREQRGQHTVNAGADQGLLHGRNNLCAAQPAHRSRAVLRRAAEVLVTHQVVQVGAGHQPGRAVAHAGQQALVGRFGRHVHGHFGATAAAQLDGWRAAAHKGAHAGVRVDQPAFACLGIAARHRGVVQAQVLRQLAQRGQAVARRKPAHPHVFGNQVGQQKVGRLAAGLQTLVPLVDELVHGQSDCRT